MQLKICPCADQFYLPVYGSDRAAGMDVMATERLVLFSRCRHLFKLGFKVEIPAGFELQVRPRSGLAIKHGITVLNSPGTIDEDYRGEVGVILYNTSDDRFVVEPGMKIAQLVMAQVERPEIIIDGTLSETSRGEGGFGSTGL